MLTFDQSQSDDIPCLCAGRLHRRTCALRHEPTKQNEMRHSLGEIHYTVAGQRDRVGCRPLAIFAQAEGTRRRCVPSQLGAHQDNVRDWSPGKKALRVMRPLLALTYSLREQWNHWLMQEMSEQDASAYQTLPALSCGIISVDHVQRGLPHHVTKTIRLGKSWNGRKTG